MREGNASSAQASSISTNHILRLLAEVAHGVIARAEAGPGPGSGSGSGSGFGSEVRARVQAGGPCPPTYPVARPASGQQGRSLPEGGAGAGSGGPASGSSAQGQAQPPVLFGSGGVRVEVGGGCQRGVRAEVRGRCLPAS